MARLEFPAPTGGIDQISSPAEMKATRARTLDNWLVHYPNRIVLRGPLAPSQIIGTVGQFGSLKGFAPMSGKILVQGSGSRTAIAALNGTNDITVTTRATDVKIFDGRAAHVGSKWYGPSTVADQFLLSWDGSTGTPVSLTHGPTGASDVAAHLSRLFVAVGSTIYWSDLGGPAVDTAGEWTDDASGLTNQAVIGSEGDPIVALLSLGRQLLVLKQNSIWTVLGDTPSSFVVRQLSNRVGCVAKTSVIAVDDYCIFVGRDGAYAFDAASGLQSLSQDAIDWSALALPSAGQLVSAASLPHSHVVFATGGGKLLLCYLPSLAWTTLSSEASVARSGRAAAVFNDEIGNAYVVGTAVDGTGYVSHLNFVTDPAAAVRAGKGWPTEENIGGSGLVATWEPWLADLGDIDQHASMERLFLAYRAQTDGDGGLAPIVFLGARDESGNEYLAEQPSVEILTETPTRQYHEVDYFAEADVLNFQVVASFQIVGSMGMVVFELHRAGVIYEQTATRT